MCHYPVRCLRVTGAGNWNPKTGTSTYNDVSRLNVLIFTSNLSIRQRLLNRLRVGAEVFGWILSGSESDGESSVNICCLLLNAMKQHLVSLSLFVCVSKTGSETE